MTERRGPTSLELRLYAVSVLALVYVIAWRAIGREPAPVAEPVPVPTTTTARWLDELPVAERPALAPPTGWRVVDRTAAAPAPAPRVVPARRPLRVRTRSS